MNTEKSHSEVFKFEYGAFLESRYADEIFTPFYIFSQTYVYILCRFESD